MKINSKLTVFGASLLGAMAAGLALSATANSTHGASPGRGIYLAPALDDEGDEADEAPEMDLRDVAPKAKIALSKAIALALGAQPGRAVEAGLEGELDGDKADIFFEVMIVGPDKKLHEVKLSHLDGRLIENSVEDGEEEAKELVVFNEALRHSELTLEQLIASAGGLVNGQAVSASLDFDDEGPECEVLIVNGRYIVGVDVEARAGHILEVELAGQGDEDDQCGSRAGEDDDEDGAWEHDDDDDGVQRGHQDDDDDHGGEEEDEDDD